METQQHVFEKCGKIHNDEENKVMKEDIFSEDLETLRETA
jgi:hypothetical protein